MDKELLANLLDRNIYYTLQECPLPLFGLYESLHFKLWLVENINDDEINTTKAIFINNQVKSWILHERWSNYDDTTYFRVLYDNPVSLQLCVLAVNKSYIV